MIANPLHDPNPDFDRLYVFGAGGHGREICWLAEQSWNSRVSIEFLVDRAEFLNGQVNGRPVQLLQELRDPAGARFVVALGNSRDRERIALKCDALGLIPASLVHPRVEASQSVELGPGCVVCAGTILTSNITLGAHVHVNVHCSISHDVDIGDFTTLSPDVHVSGNVRIGKHVFLGAGAVIVNGQPGKPLVIDDGAVIAAAACVTQPVAAGALVAGVPAIRKR